ncbi:hypothetical protein BaRGS_00007432 [Batillaria attramentaria]|uniref:Uncharacterized protein n=1 Tax=Batillaria attramentaria TaxID=370345 RepID=A0ABD0LPP3_9CAEN
MQSWLIYDSCGTVVYTIYAMKCNLVLNLLHTRKNNGAKRSDCKCFRFAVSMRYASAGAQRVRLRQNYHQRRKARMLHLVVRLVHYASQCLFRPPSPSLAHETDRVHGALATGGNDGETASIKYNGLRYRVWYWLRTNSGKEWDFERMLSCTHTDRHNDDALFEGVVVSLFCSLDQHDENCDGLLKH